MNTAQNTTEETPQITKPNASEVIAQVQYASKIKVQKIMKKPNYFKCRNYIIESTKRSVNRIVADKAQIIPKLAGYEKNESYSAYVRRVREKKVIMN